MTQKELLYVEDAINHEQMLIDITTETINLLQDEDLKKFLSSEIKKYTNVHNKLVEVLEAASNE